MRSTLCTERHLNNEGTYRVRKGDAENEILGILDLKVIPMKSEKQQRCRKLWCQIIQRIWEQHLGKKEHLPASNTTTPSVKVRVTTTNKSMGFYNKRNLRSFVGNPPPKRKKTNSLLFSQPSLPRLWSYRTTYILFSYVPSHLAPIGYKNMIPKDLWPQIVYYKLWRRI